MAAMWRHCGGTVVAMWWHCGGIVAALWRHCGGTVAALWRRCDGTVVALWWHCGGTRESTATWLMIVPPYSKLPLIAQQLCSLQFVVFKLLELQVVVLTGLASYSLLVYLTLKMFGKLFVIKV